MIESISANIPLIYAINYWGFLLSLQKIARRQKAHTVEIKKSNTIKNKFNCRQL